MWSSRLLLVAVLFATHLSLAGQALAQERQPGDGCTTAGHFTRSGGAEIPNGHFMVCDGAHWISIIDYLDTGHTLTQIGDDTANPCTPAKEGRISYTGGDPPWKYCDGSDWVNFKQPRCEDDDIGECYLDATRDVADPDFVAANIADGVNILGVTGTFTGGGGGGGCSEGGLAMGGYCWYFGEDSQSCTAVCSSRGGYHQATRDFAGSSAANCKAIFDAFMAGLGGPVHEDYCPSGLGCFFALGGRCAVPFHKLHKVRATQMCFVYVPVRTETRLKPSPIRQTLPCIYTLANLGRQGRFAASRNVFCSTKPSVWAAGAALVEKQAAP